MVIPPSKIIVSWCRTNGAKSSAWQASHLGMAPADPDKALNALRRIASNKVCGSCPYEERMGFKDVCIYADTYPLALAKPCCTLPEAQGSLARGRLRCTHAVRVPASGVPYVPRTVYRGTAGLHEVQDLRLLRLQECPPGGRQL